MEKEKSTIKIFISTIKPFYPQPADKELFTIITGEENKDVHSKDLDIIREPQNPYQHCLNEYSRMFYLWEEYLKDNMKPDYVGFCSYRRYLAASRQEMEEALKTKKILLPYQMDIGYSVLNHYGLWHNANDLVLATEIIRKQSPKEYDEAITKVLDDHYLYTNGLYVMPYAAFTAFMNWMADIWNEFRRSKGWESDEDVLREAENNINNNRIINSRSTADYQARIWGFLAERLLSIYVEKNYAPDDIGHFKIYQTDIKK